MTGPEANQQYDLWVDRCRQQLERGAAGNALAAWMLSEGVSAEMAETILQAARDASAVEAQQAIGTDTAPATPAESVSPEATVPEATAPVSAAPNTATPQAQTQVQTFE